MVQRQLKKVAVAALLFSTACLMAQAPSSDPAAPKTAPKSATAGPAFEVATIKPVEPDAKKGRYLILQGTNRFVGKYYTLKLLIAAAYNLSPKVISGGPPWIDSDHYDILALTPGETRPSRDEQMAMLRTLLTDRFALAFHRESKDFSIYALETTKGGPKYGSESAPGLKPSMAAPGEPSALISTVYPDHIKLPARNASMGEFAELLQRAVLDRPVVDRTGLTGKFDFDLEWAPDETQFGGEVPVAPTDAQAPPFFTAIQQQLGLRLEATRGPVEALVVDHADRPSAN
ncbi:MAG TPA: TIGR03435 family protein [Terracidiphilus sp.]|nr:TIGR03435 family protein [Terracidiphilus sp.]